MDRSAPARSGRPGEYAERGWGEVSPWRRIGKCEEARELDHVDRSEHHRDGPRQTRAQNVHLSRMCTCRSAPCRLGGHPNPS